MYPLLLKIDDFVVSSHDLFLAAGFFVGTWIIFRQLKRDVESPAKILNLATWMIIAAIIGARLFHVAVEAPGFYIKHPLNIFMIWNGGWTFYGGFLLCIITGIVFMKKNSMNIHRTVDMYTPAVALGLSFGRMGCFMAGCCYGKVCPTDFSLGVTFKIINHVKPQAQPLNVSLYPTQIAEALVAQALFFYFLFFRSKKRFHGQFAAIFLIVYGLARFLIEYFRADSIRGMWFGNTLSTSQIISLPLIALGVFIIFTGIKQKS